MTTETPNASPEPATPVPLAEQSRVSGDEPPPRSTGPFWLALIALVAALLVAAYAHRQLDLIKRESARRMAEMQRLVTEAQEVANRADAEARAARRQAGLVESRLAEEQGQRESLEQLYSELTRGHDEAILVEVERLITLAAQELQMGGNVPTALAALQTADSRLSRVDTARFVPLRRVLARDIERLKAAPSVDTTGIALKLDQLAASVDQWPLLAEGSRASAAAERSAREPEVEAPPSDLNWWQKLLAALRRELSEHRDLIRIRQVETPEALLLNDQQQQLVRQQIRLRMLSARHALLARNDRLFRADLAQAQALISRYIDTGDPQAATALASIRQLAGTQLSVELPQIGETLAAVRTVRTAPAPR